MDFESICSLVEYTGIRTKVPYTFVGGQAFTEDGILIFNIKACVIPHSDYIKEYFEKFGKVLNVHRNCTTRFFEYYIQYAEAASAACALSMPNYHRIKGNPIHIGACHSLQQPDGQNYLAHLNKKDYNIQNNNAAIFTLNADCLEHICKFLTPRDQINFALSCRRFSEVLALLSKVEYKNFDLTILKQFTLFEVCLFIQIVGPQIKTLTIRNCAKFGPELLLCPWMQTSLINVKKLKIVGNYSNILPKLVGKMYQLQELEMIQTKFNNEFIETLPMLKNLQKLHIFNNSDITGSGIIKLTVLKELTLFQCPRILRHYFKDFIEHLSSLNYLDIRSNTFEMDTEDYEHLTSHLQQLQTLKIICDKGNFNCLTNLPNLVRLEIELSDPKDFFVHLAERLENQLEVLGIKSMNVTLKDAKLVSKLKRLKVIKCNFNLTDEIMEEIVKLKELEEIEICKEFTDYGIIKLLKNCLKLKLVWLLILTAKQTGLIPKSREIVEKQCEQGIRTRSVNFVINPCWDCAHQYM